MQMAYEMTDWPVPRCIPSITGCLKLYDEPAASMPALKGTGAARQRAGAHLRRGRLIKVYPSQDLGGGPPTPTTSELRPPPRRRRRSKSSAARRHHGRGGRWERLFEAMPWAKLRQGHKLIRLRRTLLPWRLGADAGGLLSVDLRRPSRAHTHRALEQEATLPGTDVEVVAGRTPSSLPAQRAPLNHHKEYAHDNHVNSPRCSSASRLGDPWSHTRRRGSLYRTRAARLDASFKDQGRDELNPQRPQAAELRLQRAGSSRPAVLAKTSSGPHPGVTLDTRRLTGAGSLQFLDRSRARPASSDRSAWERASSLRHLGYTAVQKHIGIPSASVRRHFFRADGSGQIWTEGTDKTLLIGAPARRHNSTIGRSTGCQQQGIPLLAGHRQASYPSCRCDAPTQRRKSCTTHVRTVDGTMRGRLQRPSSTGYANGTAIRSVEGDQLPRACPRIRALLDSGKEVVDAKP